MSKFIKIKKIKIRTELIESFSYGEEYKDGSYDDGVTGNLNTIKIWCSTNQYLFDFIKDFEVVSDRGYPCTEKKIAEKVERWQEIKEQDALEFERVKKILDEL